MGQASSLLWGTGRVRENHTRAMIVSGRHGRKAPITRMTAAWSHATPFGLPSSRLPHRLDAIASCLRRSAAED
jgi:hypothetical protein